MKIQIALAALKPSEYRKYVKGWKARRPEIRARLKEAFGGKYRSKPIDFIVGIGHIKPPLVIAEYFREKRIDIDYALGLAYPKNRPKGIRIGKLLPADLLKVYNEDGQRVIERKGTGDNREEKIVGGLRDNIREVMKNKDSKHQIIISRHPYDMIDAVHGRDLPDTSMRVGGPNEHRLINDTELSLIAFITRPPEKPSDKKHTVIDNVIGRIWIRPYVNAEGNIIWMSDRKTYPISLNVEEAYAIINRWLNQNLNKARGSDTYKKHPEIYTDGFSPTIRYRE